ncbi:uncharacterized protein LOC135693494 [Rhopilema esculentum]|uniref:uncharacterized protein LOC135693494 n=1 Tax=Rhopilema esculentum TaxID=499914 RepID=UPI0031D94D74
MQRKKIIALQKRVWYLRNQNEKLCQQISEDKESQPSCSKDENPETTSIFVDLNQSFESVEMDESFSDTDWSHKDEECDLSSDDNDNEAGNSNYRNSVRIEPDVKPHDEPKFIVFYSMLLSICQQFCFNCKHDAPTVDVRRNGTMCIIAQDCDFCGKQFIWKSQPYVHGRYPAGNLMTSLSILLSGISISQAFLMFKHMGLSMITPRTYFLHQIKFLFPAVFDHWRKYQAALIE